MSASLPNLFSNYPMTASYPQLSNQPQGVSHENHQLMVQKYESVLQSLNHEFKKALEQTKSLQEEVAHHEHMQIKDKRLINDLQATLEQKEGSDSIEALIIEKNEIKFEYDKLSNLVLELRFRCDNFERDNSELNSVNESLRKANDTYRDNEFYMQQKYEEIRQKVSAKDAMLRQKDEVIFGFSRENEALRADIRNFERVEEALKIEIDELVNKRKTLEDINQTLKNQI